MIRRKIFIIHGKSITFQETLLGIVSLLKTKIQYYVNPENKNEGYYFDADEARFFRYIFYEKHTNPILDKLKLIFLIKVVISKFYINEDFKPNEDWLSLSQFKVNQLMADYNISSSDSAQKDFCEKNFNRAIAELSKLLGCKDSNIDSLTDFFQNSAEMLGNETEGKYLERQAGDVIVEKINSSGGNSKETIKALIEIKRSNEVGGDLDTIGSNSLYGIWAINTILKETGEQAVYGRDFDFDFVNYNEGLLHLTKYENCDIYIPDFPIEAIPDLEGDVNAIVQTGSYIVSFDDHHPWTVESKNILDKLVSENKIGSYAMSGPLDDAEIPKEQAKCGTDMVYKKFIKDTEIEHAGIRELVRLAHVQDLHIEEDKMAIDLSKLIGSKHSKLDMVQQLMMITSKDDLDNILKITGWESKIKEYENELSKVCVKLEDQMIMAELTGKITKEKIQEYYNNKMSGGKKKMSGLVKTLTAGLFDLKKFFYKFDPSNRHKILLLMSPFQSAKEAKINVASAINYFKDKLEYDYMFYCYGGSLMTMRRVNENDTSINLSVFAENLGEGGGHAEAATTKPSANPNFPKKFYKKNQDGRETVTVNKFNFLEYARYIAMQVAKIFNYQLIRVYQLPPITKKD